MVRICGGVIRLVSGKRALRPTVRPSLLRAQFGQLTQFAWRAIAISPWQTKAAPNWAKNYLFNFYRRIGGELLFFGIPFAIGA